MVERIVEQGSKHRIKTQLICDWLPNPEFNIDYTHNLCRHSCDGRDISCKFHPSYVPVSRSDNQTKVRDYQVK